MFHSVTSEDGLAAAKGSKNKSTTLLFYGFDLELEK